MTRRSNKRGFGITEVIIGASILCVAMLGLLTSTQRMIKLARENEESIKASLLLEEGVEAIRTIRDRGWTNSILTLNAGTNYYYNFTGGVWVATTTATTTDGTYIRTFSLQNVTRDTNNDIADSGTTDNGTKKYTVTVSWLSTSGATTSRTATGYITNLFNN